MDKFSGIIGIVLILGLAFLFSNNRKAINYKLVASGLLIQLGLAFFILKIPIGQEIFAKLGTIVTKILDFSDKGAEFVFGILVEKKTLEEVFGIGKSFIFFFKIIPTIIFVSVLVSIAYQLGLMQRIVAVIARIVHFLMGVSGSEALSNVAMLPAIEASNSLLVIPSK